MRKEMLFSLVLAIGIVAIALWVANYSMKPKSPESLERTEREGYRNSATRNTAPVGNSESYVNDAASDSRSTNQKPTTSISKCTMNGKTVYSDQECPNGAKSHTVALHDSAGIVSPQRENLAEITAKRIASEKEHALQVKPNVLSIGLSSRYECAELDKLSTHWDALARQPQFGAMQDWIKGEKKAVRDRQFTMRC